MFEDEDDRGPMTVEVVPWANRYEAAARLDADPPPQHPDDPDLYATCVEIRGLGPFNLATLECAAAEITTYYARSAPSL